MIKTILFDVDGVFLSEERYFDASALTVWEMMHSPQFLHLPEGNFTPAPTEETIRSVRQTVFAKDEVLNFIKSRGINSNWDMVFLSFGYQLIRLCKHVQQHSHTDVVQLLSNQVGKKEIRLLAEQAANLPAFVVDYAAFTADFAKGPAQKAEMLTYLNVIAREHCGVETEIFSRNSELWKLCQETFQEWYLGDALIEQSIGRPTAQPGKKGFLSDEIAIVEPARVREILEELASKGITLGIGTGRPTIETHVPFQELNLLHLFDSNRIVTASHVLDAEQEYPDAAPLAKPHPHCYVRGLVGLDKPISEVMEYSLPIANPDEVLIVGDSFADFLAARAIGCRFAATLTGLSGQEARAKFEQEKADYILDDVSQILELFK